VGFEWGGLNVSGCDSATCLFKPGWRCQQPGVDGLPDAEGPVRVPGPGGTNLTVNGVLQGWGEVPLATSVTCWCANSAGTYANTSNECVAQPCPFPVRCVDRTTPANGTVCKQGSSGAACDTCSPRWYKYNTDCLPCPSGPPVAIILLSIGLGGMLLYVGPKLTSLASPQALAVLRSLVMYLQYLSLSFSLRLHWPQQLVKAFAWLRALTDGIELAAPECMVNSWNYYSYVQALLIGITSLFAAAFLVHQFAIFQARFVRLHGPDVEPGAPACVLGLFRGGNERAFRILRSLREQKNAMKQFAAFALGVAYVYITGVLLQAWSCYTSSDGTSKMFSDPDVICTTPKHAAFRSGALVVLVIVAPGVPLGYALWIRHLQRRAQGRFGETRPVRWCGLADPATREAWGVLYEMVRSDCSVPRAVASRSRSLFRRLSVCI